MYSGKFVDLSPGEQETHVQENYTYDPAKVGWYTEGDEYVGASIADVIAALIDLEDAEINSIGDCMSGFCVNPPKLADFVRKKK